MAINYVPLDKEKHKDLKIAVQNSFKYAGGTHLAAASIREFAQLGSCMPIVFIQDPKAERYHVVAMLGMEANQNMYIEGDKWKAPHVPMNILRYPFDVRPDGDKLGVFIDENCDMFGDEGERLFTESGEPSEFLQNRQNLLGELANSEMVTKRFVEKVVELDLLDPIQIRLTYVDGSARNVTGMFSINERKLLELSDEVVLELHKNGFLGAMYALMLSLGQLNRLVELSNSTDKPIQNMQLSAANAAAQEQAAAQ
ncbi:SapC family protein [Alteromonas sp. CYL-A6]|uniref:SapC family protein n=1 Tax=Alteromonas nitratireducens TaxID=3390813 RepID=UPI0034B67432